MAFYPTSATERHMNAMGMQPAQPQGYRQPMWGGMMGVGARAFNYDWAGADEKGQEYLKKRNQMSGIIAAVLAVAHIVIAFYWWTDDTVDSCIREDACAEGEAEAVVELECARWDGVPLWYLFTGLALLPVVIVQWGNAISKQFVFAAHIIAAIVATLLLASVGVLYWYDIEEEGLITANAWTTLLITSVATGVYLVGALFY